MLPFPLIPFLLKPLNLTLEMLSLDINLSQPTILHQHRTAQNLRGMTPGYLLLRSLLQVLLSLIQLLLQKLHLSCQVFPSRTVGLTLVRSCLELLDLGLGRFELLFGKLKLMLKRGKLLITFEESLVKLRFY